MTPIPVANPLPLFRSESQARLLAHVFLHPDEEMPLRQLARELGLDASVVSREAARLERAGIVSAKLVGRSKIVHPNAESPYYPELSRLILKAFGPIGVLRELLDDLPGVERAFLYGSWASRYAGEPGDPPRDIDLLVVGAPNRHELSRRCRAASEKLGLDVSPILVPLGAWDGDETGFIRSIKKQPLINLHPPVSNGRS